MGLFIDGLIILIYFVGIIAIGLYVGRREKSLSDFALGGRKVPWWAVMASIIAAETSAATFLGAPGEGYDKRSLAYVQLVIGLIIGRFLVGNIFLKPYYKYKVYTVYDYIGVRFGHASKTYVSGLFLLMRTLASGTRLFVPSIIIVLAWRMIAQGEVVQYGQASTPELFPYFIAIVVLTIITAVYTSLGGIKAVIWTDVIQACLMFGSALVAIGMLLYHIGGMGELLKYVPDMATAKGYIVTGFEPSAVQKYMSANHVRQMGVWEYFKLIFLSDYTIFSALIGATLGNMAAFGTDQDMVQRMLTAETHKKARKSLITAAFMDLPIAASFTFIGILLFVYFQKFPTFKPVASNDMFGAYILHAMPVGVRGLVLAGVFATAMGSLSAALNALATSATNDWYIKYVRNKPEHHYVAAARFFTVLFAVLMVLIATITASATLADPKVRIIPVVLGIAGFILGPMLGVFLIGMLTKSRGSDKGNIIAVTCGLFATVVLGDLHITVINAIAPKLSSWLPVSNAYQRLEWMPKISFTWFAMIGALVVFAVGVFFKTPQRILDEAERHAELADAGEHTPVALREG